MDIEYGDTTVEADLTESQVSRLRLTRGEINFHAYIVLHQILCMTVQ